MNSVLLYILLIPFIIFIPSQALCVIGILTHTPRVEFYGRSLASFLGLALCAIYATFTTAGLNIAGYGGLGQWTAARAFKWVGWYFTGVWFDVEEGGREILDGTRPAVFLGNHQTELDVLYLGHIFPKYCSVTAKRSLKYIPFLGWFSMFYRCSRLPLSSLNEANELIEHILNSDAE